MKTFTEVIRELSELFSEEADYMSINSQFNDLTSLLNTTTIIFTLFSISQVTFTKEVIYDELIDSESGLAFSKKLKKKVLKASTFKLTSSHCKLTQLSHDNTDNMTINNVEFSDA